MQPNQRMVFFPTIGCRCGDFWHVQVHGWVYIPTEFSRLRSAGRAAAKRMLARRLKKSVRASEFFDLRLGAFLSDNKRGIKVTIRIGQKNYAVGKSHANGHFRGLIQVPATDVEIARAGDWLTFHSPEFPAEGRAMLLSEDGLSIVSDVDDTIKITQVTDRREMLRNTFAREFKSVTGMAELYARWAKTGATFHYVTASPWHLFPLLHEFLESQQFPPGTWHMRDFRPAGRDIPKLFRKSRQVKEKHIETLMNCSPKRQFIFVGDSGESDPEMYAGLAEKYPKQVEGIYIRNVSESTAENAKKMLGGLKGNRWKIFSDAREIPI